jgi:CBS domain-containing protein
MVPEKQWDVFVSHATEDKPIVRQIAVELKKMGYAVWYDEWTLKIGDSLFLTINRGLANSRYGIVLLSKNFFNKDWPQKELGGLAALEINGKKIILPIWHGIKRDEIARYSPILADRMAAKTEKGIDSVIQDIVDVLGPSDPPNKPPQSKTSGMETGGQGNRETISSLIRTIRDDYDDKKRNKAARELRLFDEPRVVDALLESVEHDPKVRYESLVSLFELKNEKAVGIFISRLEDRSGRIRRISIRALGDLGRKSAIKPLMELIFSYDHKNREIKRPKGKGWTNNWGKVENVVLAKEALDRIIHRLDLPVKTVDEIMTPDPIVIKGKTPLLYIEEIFKRNKIWSVLVGDSNKYTGIITRTDLHYWRERKSLRTPVDAIMSKNVYSIEKDEDITKAISLILEKDVNGLAVTSNGFPCGIITRYDLLNRYAGDISTFD